MPDGGAASTGLALGGLCALTLPSLASIYYRSVPFLSRPPLAQSFILKSMVLSVGVTPNKLDEARIVSPPYTLITHMFHHFDFQHWLSNVYTLVAVGTSLDLGFLPTLIVFFGGGLAGVFSHIVANTYRVPLITAPPPSLVRSLPPPPSLQPSQQSWFSIFPVSSSASSASTQPPTTPAPPITTVDPDAALLGTITDHPLTTWFVRAATGGALRSLRERIFQISGASAGVYALVGVDVARLAGNLRGSVGRWARLVRRQRQREEQHRPRDHGLDADEAYARERVEKQVTAMVVTLLSHGVGLLSHAVGGLFAPARAGRSILDPVEPVVSHSAHVGGFLFGVLASYVF